MQPNIKIHKRQGCLDKKSTLQRTKIPMYLLFRVRTRETQMTLIKTNEPSFGYAHLCAKPIFRLFEHMGTKNERPSLAMADDFDEISRPRFVGVDMKRSVADVKYGQ